MAAKKGAQSSTRARPEKGDAETRAMQRAYEALSPLDGEPLQRAFAWLHQRLNVTTSVSEPPKGSAGGQHSVVVQPAPSHGDATATAKAFLADKKPKSDVERITTLAFVLTHHRATEAFKTAALIAANREAKVPPIGNATRAVDNAKKARYLAAVGKGQVSITTRGEALVNALPDRARVKAALAEHPMVRRKKRKKSAKSSGK